MESLTVDSLGRLDVAPVLTGAVRHVLVQRRVLSKPGGLEAVSVECRQCQDQWKWMSVDVG